jgi:hypothetical protein
MKIFKLNNRYRLGKEGYAYAMRFPNSYNKKALAVEEKLFQMYGSKWYCSSWFKRSNAKWATYTNEKTREYYIGVQEESMFTMILLGLENV